VRWPYGSVETAPIDDRDIAAVAALALRGERLAGGDYVLTGPESLTQEAQVHAIGAALGREIRFEELSPDQFRQVMPSPIADMLLAAWDAAVGRPAYVTETVAELLGRPARTFREWAAEHTAAFR
jgi:uncharacterized protein YbjT (DUF2867 family)